MNFFHLTVIFALGITGTYSKEDQEPTVSKYTVVLKSLKDNDEDVKVFQIEGDEKEEQQLIRTEKLDEKPQWNVKVRNRYITNTTTGMMNFCKFLEKAADTGEDQKIFNAALKILGLGGARCPLEPGKSKITPQVPLILPIQPRPDCPSKIVMQIFDLNFNIVLRLEAAYGGSDGLSDACYEEKMMNPFLK